MPISTRSGDYDDGSFDNEASAGNSRGRLWRRKSKNPAASWTGWEDAEELPRADLPDGQKLARTNKRLDRYIRFCAIAFPVLVIVVFFAWTTTLGEEDPVEPPGGSDRVRAEARLALQQWLADETSPLTGGYIVDWHETVSLPYEQSEDDSEDDEGTRLYSVRFIVAKAPQFDEDGRQLAIGPDMYFADVLVATNSAQSVAVLHDPSLEIMPPAFEQELRETSPWVGVERANVTPEIEDAVRVWAETFTSGTPQELKSLVDDSRDGYSYIPLIGFTLESARINAAGQLWVGDFDEDASRPPRVVVSVSLTARDSDTECEECDATITYDLILDRADTAAPRVVAWGPPGSGVTLEPHQNAHRTRSAEWNRTIEQWITDTAGEPTLLEPDPQDDPDTTDPDLIEGGDD